MNAGDVEDEFGMPVHEMRPYLGQLRVYYYREVVSEERIPFEAVILHQDEHLIVVDKPHFLPVTPSGKYLQETVLVRLKRKLNLPKLVPIHRIDRDTAGLVLFTVQPHTRDAYQKLFRERRVEKTYQAIAPWRAELMQRTVYRSRLVASDAFMQMRAVEGDANALTAVEIDAVSGALARYILRPLTGQKHQLRAHMAALGAPILNDRIYPLLQASDDSVADYSLPLQLLAKSIAFVDPITAQPRHFVSSRSLAAWPTMGARDSR